MRQLFVLFIFLFTVTSYHIFSTYKEGKLSSPTLAPNQVKIDSIKPYATNETTLILPVEAKSKNFEINEGEDTLMVTLDKIAFTIMPNGRLSWGKGKTSFIKLSTKVTIDKAYLYKSKNTLFVFYIETDGEGATSRVEKIDLANIKKVWKAEIYGFNLGQPYIVDNCAYVTSIGNIGKIDLKTGKYLYRFQDLYDDEKGSFNSFDTVTFSKDLTFFISNNTSVANDLIRVDSVIVNEKTKTIKIKK